MRALRSLARLVGRPSESRFQSDVAPEGVDDGVDRPNFVVVVTDDMRDSDWRALRKTRQLVADAGTVFPNFFLTTPICSPSRATILTGLYAHNHGVTRNSGKKGGYAQFKQRNLGERSIPGALKIVGYRTGLFGKFMNGMPEKGGLPGGWSRWMASAELAYYRPQMNDNGKERDFSRKSQYSTDIIAARAEEFIRTTSAEQPLFLLFTPKAPHGPSTAARRDRGTFGDAFRERSPDVNEADVSDKPGYVRRGSGKGLSGLDDLERKRLDSLVSVDDAVERLIEALVEEGRWENTYMFVLSDNGFLMGSHRLMTKGPPYREATRVMMAVRGPLFAVGLRDEFLCANIDIAPTIAALADVELLEADGVSLLGDRNRDAVVLEAFGGGASYSALRRGQVLYVENTSGERELYDYVADPYEMDNLLATWEGHTPSAEAEATAQGLKSRLDDLRDCAGATCT